MEKRLVVSQSPHIKTPRTTPAIMLDVVIALLPAAVMGSIIFGWRALLVLLTCTATAVISEFLFCALTKREQSVGDLTAVITGLLLGLNLRADTPLWQCVLGSVFAIVVVKCLFGGTGSNFANPAVTGRIFMMLCFAGAVSGGTQLLPGEGGAELVSTSTPLSAITAGSSLPSLFDMFFGFYGGAIGETCTAALLVGFVYLVIRRVIYFETPLIFIGTVFVLSLIVDNSLSDFVGRPCSRRGVYGYRLRNHAYHSLGQDDFLPWRRSYNLPYKVLRKLSRGSFLCNTLHEYPLTLH